MKELVTPAAIGPNKSQELTRLTAPAQTTQSKLKFEETLLLVTH